MLINDIMNKEYRLCDFKEREKSVTYRVVDIDSLLLKNTGSEDEDSNGFIEVENR